ncbi:MAG TPA: DUF1015 family protein [Myxococcota bacterium]|nr:DUF1015 family protein [Myxococcota bacterium]
MARVSPFRGLRPRPELAAAVAAVPYDVVNRAEARALAAGNPHSFLHVTKPEIDLDDGVDLHDERVYRGGAAAFAAMFDAGTLVRDPEASYYVYELTMGAHRQTGWVVAASVDDYDRGVIKRHEYTRPDKENDRVRHMEALGAQSGKVFLVHRDAPALAERATLAKGQAPVADVTASDGVQHRVWRILDPAGVAAVTTAFAELGPLYIADGHHRAAAASRVAAAARERGDGREEPQRMLAVAFPASQTQILAYNRVVRDLGGLSVKAFLKAVQDHFGVTPGKPEPIAPRQFGMYIEGAWHTLHPRPGSEGRTDPVGRLDVSVLQDTLLAPILGIGDPRRDERIDFVGGIRGDAELERRVRDGWAVAFKLRATRIEDLLAVADAGTVMPPKSTWFEPKLRDGLVIHTF